MSASNMPAASYFPTGYSEYSLPMGKYYPSNYESTQNRNGRPVSGTLSSPSTEPRSPGFAFPLSPSVGVHPEQPSADARRQVQLQQYNRDMIAQAARAANEIAAQQNTTNINPASGATTRGLRGVTGMGLEAASMLHKPNSPRLHPLGSPGPVTPMELESSGGSYLDKSIGNDMRSSQSLAPPGKGLTPSTT